MSSSPVCRGMLCRAYVGYLKKIYKKEEINYEFKDLWEKYIKKLGIRREDMLILMPYALTVDFNMG